MKTFGHIGGFFRDGIDPEPTLDALEPLCRQYQVAMTDLSHHEMSADVDLIIAFGGDGTVLRAFERFPDLPSRR